MLRVGLIDLDTTHARSFTRRLGKVDGVAVTAVFDGGQVRTGEQIDEFCRQFDCQRHDSVESLTESVDAAMVLSADWQVHLARATPLLEAGVPTYIDKPLAGSVAELQSFVTLAKCTGTPLLAGSGWRFNPIVQAAGRKYADATIDNVFGMVGNEYFYYGIHVVEAALALLGPGIESVQLLVQHDRAHLLEFAHTRGSGGHMLLQGPRPLRGLLFAADGVDQCVTFGADDIHDGICGTFLKMVHDGQAPLPPSALIESTLVMFAGLQSIEEGRPVGVDNIASDAACSSAAFMVAYVRSANVASLLGRC